MRTTVGPLPAAVYWRRRVTVLAAVLVVIFGLVYACSDEKPPTQGAGAGAGNQIPTGGTASEDVLVPEVGTTFEESTPPRPRALPDPADVPAGPAPQPPATSAQPTGACTDDELQVRPVPARTAAPRGTPVDMRLLIKNVSDRSCSRDVGAAMQEVYIKIGARKVWSSDTCGLSRGSEVREFSPGMAREYRVTWNGHSSTRCSGSSAAGPIPGAGNYEVFGRLGEKVSEPVRLRLLA